MPSQTQQIRVMLVEDSAEYRRIVGLALADQPDMQLAGQFGTTEVAIRSLTSLPVDQVPDVVLLDLRLPGMGGLDAISRIHAVAPASRIVVLSQSDAPHDIFRAISAGVSGYLLKSATLTEIVDGIRSVAAGEATLDKHVSRHILERLRGRGESSPAILTDRERDILELLAEGLVKKEISKRLRIGYATVDTHVTHIYAKLHVANAPAAVSRAYQQGLLSPHFGPRQ